MYRDARTKKILLIDDIDAIRRDLSKFINPPVSARERATQLIRQGSSLAGFRHEIHEARQGQDGVDKVRAAMLSGSPYDIIIVDMLMPPGINGVETIRRIREFDREAVVLVCTAETSASAEAIKEANAGFCPIMLYKPVDGYALANLVNSIGRGQHGSNFPERVA